MVRDHLTKIFFGSRFPNQKKPAMGTMWTLRLGVLLSSLSGSVRDSKKQTEVLVLYCHIERYSHMLNLGFKDRAAQQISNNPF